MNELDREKKAEELLKDIRVEKPDDDGEAGSVIIITKRPGRVKHRKYRLVCAKPQRTFRDYTKEHNDRIADIIKQALIQRHHKRSLEGIEIEQTEKDVGYGIV